MNKFELSDNQIKKIDAMLSDGNPTPQQPNLTIMQDGIIDHKKNLDIFLNLDVDHLRFPEKVKFIIKHELSLHTVHQFALFLMNNGNKQINTLFPINHKLKYRFRTLRGIVFQVVSQQTGTVFHKNADKMDYIKLVEILSKAGLRHYLNKGAIIPKSALPYNAWISLSESQIEAIIEELKQEESPITMAMLFTDIISKMLNLSISSKNKKINNKSFSRQCSKLHRYQTQKGGLIYSEIHQFLSLNWVYELNQDFIHSDWTALTKTTNNFTSELKNLILSISSFNKANNNVK